MSSLYDWTIGWALKLDVASLVVGTIFGTIASTWFSFFIQRPILQVVGGGSGSGGSLTPRTRSNHITIQNSPGIFGIRLGETTIFGRQIIPPIQWGLAFDRKDAAQCRAWIYDSDTKRGIRPLWWQTRDGKMVQEMTIKSGETGNLFVFARLEDEPGAYFIYQPAGHEGRDIQIPPPEGRQTDSHDFYIEVRYTHHTRRLRINWTMRKDFDGKLYYESQGGGGGSF